MSYQFPKGYLSPSQITRYLTCPACYSLEYVDHVAKPMSVNLPIGGAVHRAVEEMRRRRIDMGTTASTEEMVDLAVEHFTGDGLGFDKESQVEVELDLGKYETLDKAKDDVVRFVRYAVPELSTLDEQRGIIAAELDLKDIDAGNVWPFEMRGRIDALYGDSETMAPSILGDLKTSSKQQAPDINAAVQFGIYRHTFWKNGHELAVLADVLAKTKTPSLTTYSMSASDAEQANVERLVLDVAQRITEGYFPPRPGFLCSYSHGLPAFSVAVQGFAA